MLDEFKKLLANQFEAAFCTLNACIDGCSESTWNAPVANLAFCQVAFHTLFFADYYLGQNEESLRGQPFHLANQQFFRNYEELQDRKQEWLYDKPSVKDYLQHGRSKAVEAIAAETAETLNARCDFPSKQFSRAELHVTNIRHIQHHAAQLSLRLRIDADTDIPWFASGWCEL